MNTTRLELTDSSRTEFLPKENPTNSSSDCSEDDSFIGKGKKTTVILYSFIKCYLNQCKLVIQTIIPDLKGFKGWEILLLILFGAFNVTFSILVKKIQDFLVYRKKYSFYFQRILMDCYHASRHVQY